MQIATLDADLVTLKEELRELVTKLKTLETSYRASAIEDFGMEEETVKNKIDQAKDSPQTSKHLQSIYEVHQELQSKRTEIEEAERELVALKTQFSAATKATSTDSQQQVDVQVTMTY